MSSELAKIYRRVIMALGRGRVTLVNDRGPVQLHQVKLGAQELQDGMPRLPEFGLASNPPAGSDAVAVFLAGERSNGVIIATEHQAYRLRNLGSGEVAIYNQRGASVWLKNDSIVIEGGGMPITINNAPTLTHNGDLVVNGQISATGNVTAGEGGGDQVTLQGHKHPTAATGSPSAPTPGT